MTLIQTLLFYIAAIVSICCVSVGTRSFKHSKIWLFCYSLLVLTLISGLRSASVGTDTQMYIDACYEIGNSSFPFSNIRYELGFSLLMNVCYKISNSPQFMLLVTSFIINFCILHFIFKMSPDPSFSILLYILSFNYFISFNLMRQYLGMSIAIAFIPCLKRKHYFFFILGCLLSAAFHKICILFLVFLVTPFLKKDIRVFLLILLSTLVILILGDNLLIPIIKLLHFDSYLNSVFFTSWGVMNALFDLMFPLICLVLIFLSYSKQSFVYKPIVIPSSTLNPNAVSCKAKVLTCVDEVKTKELSIAQSITFYSITISACFSILKINWWIMNRLASLFSCVGILLLPVILKKQRNYLTNKAIAITCFTILFIVGALGLHNFNDAFIYSFGKF